MAKFIIAGQPKLAGTIKVFGAKNAAIKMIAGSCLISGQTILENVPDILDIQKIINILEKLGVKFHRHGHILRIDTEGLQADDPDPRLVGDIRASIVLAGPLLARFGKLKIPHPGGCTIGSRPIDLHLKAFKKLGVVVEEKGNFYHFSYNQNQSVANRENACRIRFEKISVTATENILLFASLLEKKIILENVAIEPEVLDLIEFLKKAGVKISLDKRLLEIRGQKLLKPVIHKVIPDRIEAGTFAIMAATTKSPLKIVNFIPEHLEALLEKFTVMGIPFVLGKNFLYIKKPTKISATDISTAEYPGFPTDLQPPMGVLLTQAEGVSHLKENIFEHRLGYLLNLQKMGAQIKLISSTQAEISGPAKLHEAKLESLDLRAGATLLIAGLAATGTTEIKHAENIDRGYEKIEERLRKIGAKIKRVQ